MAVYEENWIFSFQIYLHCRDLKTELALGIMVTSASLLSVSPQLEKVFNCFTKEIVNTKKFGKTITEDE